MAKPRIITTKCHGCHVDMVFEAVPVVITEWTGEQFTYWGKDDAIWICKTCHDDPTKLKAARKATEYLPAEAEVTHFDDDYQDSQSSGQAGARATSSGGSGSNLTFRN